MEKKKKKFDITKFESLQSKGEILKGGFSTAFIGGTGQEEFLPEVTANLGYCPTKNTCNTGNCVAGCGA